MTSDVVFIGGRSGTGKTSVGLEIHAQLSAAGVIHCLIEGDFLDMAYPTPGHHNLAERNLSAVWTNYRALGYHRLIYTNTVSVLPDEMDKLTAAMGDKPNVIAVLLTCTDITARKRLGQREIGSTLESHLTSSANMSTRLQAGIAASTRQIPTDNRSVTDIATHIIDLINWLPERIPRIP